MSMSNAVWRPDGHPAAKYRNQIVDKKPERRDLAYDNDALDVLEELFDNGNFADELLDSQTRNSPQVNRVERLQPPPANVLPDSPPYSGSEPYSPDSHKLLSPSCGSDISSHSSGYRTGPSPDSPHQYPPSQVPMPQQQLNPILAQQQLQKLQEMHRLQQLQQNARVNAGQMMVHPGVHLAMQPNSMPQMLPDDQFTQPYCGEPNSPYAAKKRKYPGESNSPTHQSAPSQLQQVKQEPVVQQQPQSVPAYDLDNGSMDISPGMLNGGSYQPIKWRDFEKKTWCPTINVQGQATSVMTYRLDGDKGFNYSQVDKAFVCQKKNHFQITGCVSLSDQPKYVMTPEGPKPIDGVFMHFYGVKDEAPNQVIQVDQSQADRSKKKFCPVPLQHNQDNSWKVTIGRLHFSDTTLNNMRKRGKPNPDQRYFLLVVGVFAHCQGKQYPIVQQCSEKLIVRASNPGQFQDSEAEPVKWQPGQTPNSVFHSGKVGINTESPDEALTVAGNVKVMGSIMQPSDERIKEDITEVDTKAQLKNVQALNLYNYKYTEEFANAVGLDDPNALETGVLAQELEVVIPEAVKNTTDVTLTNGEVVEQLKVVDKNRLFMESLGAVKELSNITESLEGKINYLERFNKKLQKLKRIGSLRSTASTDTNLSRHTSISTVSHVTVHKKKPLPLDTKLSSPDKESGIPPKGGVCSNKFLQILIFLLVLVMVACVGVIVAMLFLERSEEGTTDNASVGTSSNIRTTPIPPPTNDANGESPPANSPPAIAHVPELVWVPGVPPSDDPGFISGEVHAECRAKMMTGPGCDIYKKDCRQDTCANQCAGFLRPGQTIGEDIIAGKSTAKPLKVDLSSTISQEIDKPFQYGDVNRRKRSVPEDLADPLSDIRISVVDPVVYELKPLNCLNCQFIAQNYTYAVQVHNSFPGSFSTLEVESRSDVWSNVVKCQSPKQPDEMLCDDNTQQSVDLPPNGGTAEARSLDQTATFQTEIGRFFRTPIIFRLTNNPIVDAEEECQKPLSSDLMELRVWFMRQCNDCGNDNMVYERLGIQPKL